MWWSPRRPPGGRAQASWMPRVPPALRPSAWAERTHPTKSSQRSPLWGAGSSQHTSGAGSEAAYPLPSPGSWGFPLRLPSTWDSEDLQEEELADCLTVHHELPLINQRHERWYAVSLCRLHAGLPMPKALDWRSALHLLRVQLPVSCCAAVLPSTGPRPASDVLNSLKTAWVFKYH